MLKVALVANSDFSIHNFRMGLIRSLLARGCEVHVVCPNGEYASNFKKHGIQHHAIYVDRKGTNPIKDLRTLCQLYRLFRKEDFDLVHNFTIKPNIYGNIAARFAGVPAIANSVTGLGYVFVDNGIRRRVLKTLVVWMYMFAFRFSRRVIFLNRDDLETSRNSGIVSGSKGMLLNSEGVDTAKFSPSSVSMDHVQDNLRDLGLFVGQGHVIVTLASRLIWDKGVREYVEAARILKPIHPNALFLVVGPIDTGNPAAVSEEYVRQAETEGIIRYLGWRKDMPEVFYVSDVVVLPSYYREGMPVALLEAMSMEKPVVTTDSPGCREVVEDGRNGFLVPVKDHVALASAIGRLVSDSGLRIAMGKYGRDKAVREFDERLIVKKTLELYEEVLGRGTK